MLLLGLKFSRLGHLRTPGLCEKPQETQWLLSYFIGTPTVRNNYDYECNYNYGDSQHLIIE